MTYFYEEYREIEGQRYEHTVKRGVKLETKKHRDRGKGTNRKSAGEADRQRDRDTPRLRDKDTDTCR